MEDAKMGKETMNKNVDKREATGEKKDVLKLGTPIVFDGETVKEIDLSGLNEATGADLVSAKRMMNMSGVSLDAYPERTLEFAIALATVVLNKPEGLFSSLKAKDAMNFKAMVRDFLY